MRYEEMVRGPPKKFRGESREVPTERIDQEDPDCQRADERCNREGQRLDQSYCSNGQRERQGQSGPVALNQRPQQVFVEEDQAPNRERDKTCLNAPYRFWKQ